MFGASKKKGFARFQNNAREMMHDHELSRKMSWAAMLMTENGRRAWMNLPPLENEPDSVVFEHEGKKYSLKKLGGVSIPGGAGAGAKADNRSVFEKIFGLRLF